MSFSVDTSAESVGRADVYRRDNRQMFTINHHLFILEKY